MPIDLVIKISMAIIMFGIGLSISPQEFIDVFRNWKELILGLSLQMVLLPVLFFSALLLISIPDTWKLGIFLVSICPGGTTSNFISYLVGANKALSISLTTVNSLLILVTIPILTTWASNYYLGSTLWTPIPNQELLKGILFTLILPTAVGVLGRNVLGNNAVTLERYLRIVNISLFAIVYSVKIFASESSGGSGIDYTELTQLLPVAVSLHLLSLICAWGISKIARLSPQSSTTIGIEVGLQNTTLTLMIATIISSDQNLQKPALVFAMFTFFTALAFGWVSLYLDKDPENQDT